MDEMTAKSGMSSSGEAADSSRGPNVASACEKCGRQPIGSYEPNPKRPYLCPYCNEPATLRDEGVVVDRFHNVCHETCLAMAKGLDRALA